MDARLEVGEKEVARSILIKYFHFCSLGLSWLSSRMISTQPAASSILESLKASAYGLGRADCPKMFPCDYRIAKAATNRTRIERSAQNHIFEWDI